MSSKVGKLEVSPPDDTATTTTTKTTTTASDSSHGHDGEIYGDLHKIVLQGIMAAGFLDAKAVKTLFTAACEHLRLPEEEKVIKTSMEYVQKVVRMINEAINPFDLTIRSASCELSAKKFFLFMPTVEKSVVMFQTKFSKTEVTMMQIVMDRMMNKYSNFCVPLNECINILRDVDARAQMQKGADFIQDMIDSQYFTKYLVSKTEYDVTLGIRGIREFEPLLRDKYPDVVMTCSLCKCIMLHGYRCPKCKVLIHKACYLRYVKTVQACLKCEMPWLREKDMIRRNRVTDELISSQGMDVDLSAYSAKGRVMQN